MRNAGNAFVSFRNSRSIAIRFIKQLQQIRNLFLNKTNFFTTRQV